ncbi:MAG: hypothetical protein AB7D17_05095 [Methanobacteriales archaeon]
MDKPGLFCIGMEVENLKAKIEEFKSKGAKVTMEPTPITVGLLAFNRRPEQG